MGLRRFDWPVPFWAVLSCFRNVKNFQEIPGLDPPCPARMKMRRLPGGRFEISLKYEHQHGRVIYFFVHALSEFNLFALI